MDRRCGPSVRLLTRISQVILTTHDADEIQHLADTVVVLNKGRVVKDTTPIALALDSPDSAEVVRVVLTSMFPQRLATHVHRIHQALPSSTRDDLSATKVTFQTSSPLQLQSAIALLEKMDDDSVSWSVTTSSISDKLLDLSDEPTPEPDDEEKGEDFAFGVAASSSTPSTPAAPTPLTSLLKKDFLVLLDAKFSLLFLLLSPAIILYLLSLLIPTNTLSATDSWGLLSMYKTQFDPNPVTVNDDGTFSVTLQSPPTIISQQPASASATGYRCLNYFLVSSSNDAASSALDMFLGNITTSPCSLTACGADVVEIEDVLSSSLSCRNDCYTGRGDDYGGAVSETASGLACQQWPDSDHDYCRNPDAAMSTPWCYTSTGYDFCDPTALCHAPAATAFDTEVPFFLQRTSYYASEEEVYGSMQVLNNVPRSHFDHEPFPSYELPDGIVHVETLEAGRLVYSLAGE